MINSSSSRVATPVRYEANVEALKQLVEAVLSMNGAHSNAATRQPHEIALSALYSEGASPNCLDALTDG